MMINSLIQMMTVVVTFLTIPCTFTSCKIVSLDTSTFHLYHPLELSQKYLNFVNILSKKSITKQTRTMIKTKRFIQPKSEHLMRNTCNNNIDCETYCDLIQGLCTCPVGYISADLTITNQLLISGSHESRFCYKLKKIGETCEHQVQCFVPYSTCETIAHLGKAKSGHHNGTCTCKPGFIAQGNHSLINYVSVNFKHTPTYTF